MKEDNKKKYDLLDDEDFLNEMDRRIKEVESGEVQGIPWEEVKRKARDFTPKNQK